MPRARSIDDMDLTPYAREQHFFRKGYEYALLHFNHGIEDEAVDEKTGKKIRKHMDFLDTLKNE